MHMFNRNILLFLGFYLISPLSFALTIAATGTEGIDQSYDPATNTTTFSANTTNAIIHPATIASKLLTGNVIVSDNIDPNISLSNNTVISWNTANNLIVNAKQHIIIGSEAQIVSQNTGNLVLRADATGDNEGTLIPPIGLAPIIVLNGGSVRIYYRPKSFDAPTNFNPNIKLSAPGTATAYMAINVPTDLIRMNWSLWGNYALARNIDARDLQGLLPIGSQQYPFTGKLDGQGFAINNITIDLPAYDYVGFFSQLNNAVIENLHLININIQGQTYVGGIAGKASNSYIFNSHVSGNIKGNGNMCGGFVGDGYYTIYISQSYMEGTVQGGSSGIAGGLVGQFGGTMGIDNSYSLATVSGNGIGGLLGSANSGRLRNLFAAGPVLGTNKGGLFSNTSNGANTSLYWDKQTTGQPFPASGIPLLPGAIGYDTAQMYRKATYLDWNFDTIWGIDEGKGYPYLLWSRKPAPWTYMFNAKVGVRRIVG